MPPGVIYDRDNFGSGNGLLPSGSKPSSVAMLIQVYDAIVRVKSLNSRLYFSIITSIREISHGDKTVSDTVVRVQLCIKAERGFISGNRSIFSHRNWPEGPGLL